MAALRRFLPRSPAVIGWLCVAIASIATAIALAALAPKMNPVQPGTSAEFWECATTVHFPESPSKVYGHAYGPWDGWYYYGVSGRDGGLYIDGSPTYRVSEAEVYADFERVVDALRSPSPGVKYRERILAGFKNWEERSDRNYKVPRFLLSDLRKAREAELGAKTPMLVGHYAHLERAFENRHIRSRWYWATIVFELVFLTGIVLFAAWPAIRGLSAKRWALHLGLLPLLFMLPAYLGYGQHSFIASIGPDGGIVYPELLVALPAGSCNETDLLILRYTPPLLEPVSTMPYFPLMFKGGSMPGPTTTALLGFLVAVGILGVRLCMKICSRKSSSTSLR